MQILIPVSGYSTFFPKEEFYFPKPLIEVAGRAMIEVVVKQLQADFPNASFIFVVDKDDVRDFSLESTLRLITGKDTTIIEKAGPTAGALCSCLLSIDHLSDSQPLIIANSDQIVESGLFSGIEYLRSSKCSAGVFTFDSIHPRWSYIVKDEHGEVIQAFEKRVASRNAIAGIYYFRSASIFCSAAKQVILKDAQVEGQYFVSSSLNEVILEGGRVLYSPIDGHVYHSFYSPAKIAEFERTTLAKRLREKTLARQRVNLVIPAAGKGSRFAKAGWMKPKPFIDVNGQSMLEKVIKNVTPKDASVTILLRQDHMSAHPNIVSTLHDEGHRVISVPDLTEGAAPTVLLARDVYNNDQPLIIANSDQFVSFDVNHFIDDCLLRRLDGSIVVFNDASRDPKWSFAKVDEAGILLEVAEKNPISSLATVGIYMFTRGSDFVSAAIDMIIANDRVSNEFYICPVYNYLIRNGSSIGVYEITASSMAGLGTPEDLNKYLESHSKRPSLDSPL